MARKQRTFYPKKKSKGPASPARDPIVPPSLAVIDTTAALGRKGIVEGSRVRILGTGLYAGEVAVVERLVGGVIPAAFVRTEGGGGRQVRTIDLEPVDVAPGPSARAAAG
jgi:hypothetical protein